MSRISGLGDLQKKADEESKRNEFFAGGLDQRGGGSGLAVLGPPPSSSNRGPTGVFDNIVQRASNPSQAGDEGFSGGEAGRRLVTMYRNGFSVDDGPLRDLESPESRAFLASLERGEAPVELRRDGQDIEVHLHDKRSEDFVPPPPPAYVAFSGTGATLGGSSSAAGGGAFAFTAQTLAGVVEAAVDEGAPVTVLQVKTATGKKIRLRMNQSATVLQLAAAIARESGSSVTFALSAGFPPKDVVDAAATLSEAGLLGAAVTQRSV